MNNEEKIKNLIKVSKLYYHGHMNQQQIADMMNTSRSTIARMLMEAERKKIVRIEINDNYFDYDTAAQALMEAYDLKFVEIVPSSANIATTKISIGNVATDYLNRYITETSKIGISWGTTVSSFVSAYQPFKKFPHAKVVQIVGGVYNSASHMDGRDLARRLASKLGCDFAAMQAPIFVSNPDLRELFLEEEDTKAHFEMMKHLDIAIISIGSSDYSESNIYKAKYVDEETAKQLYANGLCDVCGHQIDMYGNEPENNLSKRLIGISLEDLKNTPMVIGMCAGNNRTAPILSCINGGYIKGLIIDEVAAIPLLQAEGIEL